MTRELAHNEWDAWHFLCDELKKAEVVTQDDCNSQVTMLETPGQKVFAAIRDWGESLVEAKRNKEHAPTEREGWIKLCARLRDAGLTIPDDGGPVGHKELCVITAAQEWGDTLVRLRTAPQE